MNMNIIFMIAQDRTGQNVFFSFSCPRQRRACCPSQPRVGESRARTRVPPQSVIAHASRSHGVVRSSFTSRHKTQWHPHVSLTPSPVSHPSRAQLGVETLTISMMGRGRGRDPSFTVVVAHECVGSACLGLRTS